MSEQTNDTAPETVPYEDLSYKHRRFIDEYFVCNMVAWRAYVAAGYGGEEPDRKEDPQAWEKWFRNVRSNSSHLTADHNIAAAIKQRLDERAMAADEVLARLADQARGSLKPFVRIGPDGLIYFDFAHPEAEEHLHLVKKAKTKRKRVWEGHGDDAEEWEHEWVEVELYDAQAALKELARVHGLTGPKGTEDDPQHVAVAWRVINGGADGS